MAMSSRKLSSTALSCFQRFEGRNSSGRAPGKNKQRINLCLVFLKMQDYVSVTIHLLRFRLTDMSQDSGVGKVGHHSFRVYWSLRSVCSRSYPGRLIRAIVLGNWVSRLKARSGKFLWERFRCKLKDSDDIFLELSCDSIHSVCVRIFCRLLESEHYRH